MQKTMTESNKIPHLLFFEEVDMTELVINSLFRPKWEKS